MRPSTEESAIVSQQGPNRYKIHTSQLIGGVTRVKQKESNILPAYSAYEVYMFNVEEVFEGKLQPWNTEYAKAQIVFGPGASTVMVRGGLHVQHRTLYREGLYRTASGWLHSGFQLLKLINFGMRDGLRKFYTYVVISDRFRFSESGAELQGCTYTCV